MAQTVGKFQDACRIVQQLAEKLDEARDLGRELRDAHNADDFSLAGVQRTITGATNATPIVITATAHGFTNGQVVKVTGVLGNTAASGVWTISGVVANTFTLVGSAGNGAYTSGGLAELAYVQKDADGNVKGFPFSPSEYLAGVTMANELEDYFTNQPVVQGDYKSTVARLRAIRRV